MPMPTMMVLFGNAYYTRTYFTYWNFLIIRKLGCWFFVWNWFVHWREDVQFSEKSRDELFVLPYESLPLISDGNRTFSKKWKKQFEELCAYLFLIIVFACWVPYDSILGHYLMADPSQVMKLLDRFVVLQFNDCVGEKMGFKGPK